MISAVWQWWPPHFYVEWKGTHQESDGRTYQRTRQLFIGWRGLGLYQEIEAECDHITIYGFGRGEAAPWWKWRFFKIEDAC